MSQMQFSARTLTVAIVTVAVLAFGIIWAGTGIASNGNAESNALQGSKVGVCHMTGSENNPSVFITVNENATKAHEAHGDIIDVESEDECPTGGEATPTQPPVATPVVDSD